MKALLLTATVLLTTANYAPSVSATPPAIIAQAEAQTFDVTVKRIKVVPGTNLVEITGTIVNRTNKKQSVGSFDYDLISKNTWDTVYTGSISVNKTIVPNGKVVFEGYIDKRDVKGVARNLELKLLGFN